MATANTRNDFYLSLSDLAVLTKEDPAQVLATLKTEFGFKTAALVPPPLVRKYLSRKGYQFPHQIISFQMLKGGVAKTTSALNFGLRAAQYGCRVLFIDLDQQANLSYALGVDAENLPVWVDIVEKKSTVQEARVSLDEGLDLIPSSLNNSVLDRALLSGTRNWAEAIRGPLKELRSAYDVIVIDTAPSLSAVNTAVTCASDIVILPINPDKFSWVGLQKNMNELQSIRSEFSLSFGLRILFTKYDGREKASREFLSLCIEQYPDLILKNYIRTSTELKNSLGQAKGIYTSKSAAKEDYCGLTQELLAWDHL